MTDGQPASGNVLVYARIRDERARAGLNHLLENLPGERVAATLYEVSTADWDPGLWEEAVERMQEIIDPSVDTLIFWQAVENQFVRTCISGRYS